jgi:hypothetical protein
MRELKASIYMYRTIKGKKLLCVSWDSEQIPLLIEKAKKEKLLYRMIDGQLYMEQVPS